jgi:hypothetical protein
VFCSAGLKKLIKNRFSWENSVLAGEWKRNTKETWIGGDGREKRRGKRSEKREERRVLWWAQT